MVHPQIHTHLRFLMLLISNIFLIFHVILIRILVTSGRE
jgi:hypothetical protein